jgi:hypothetical protein
VTSWQGTGKSGTFSYSVRVAQLSLPAPNVLLVNRKKYNATIQLAHLELDVDWFDQFLFT